MVVVTVAVVVLAVVAVSVAVSMAVSVAVLVAVAVTVSEAVAVSVTSLVQTFASMSHSWWGFTTRTTSNLLLQGRKIDERGERGEGVYVCV